MREKKNHPLVALRTFIQATRDSGYRDVAWAISELVDNSFEANADEVIIKLIEKKEKSMRDVWVVVSDNGEGMKPKIMQLALQFGGSTRYDSRIGSGRYGMGLPNSSLSQARRVELYSWTQPKFTWWTYMDIDEIAAGKVSTISFPKRKNIPLEVCRLTSESGTVVVWHETDRLKHKKIKLLIEKLQAQLGQIFREHLWTGKTILVNGEKIMPVDPLLLRKGNNLKGAKRFGPPLNYDIRISNSKKTSKVSVQFVELPLEKWHLLSNEEKRSQMISKGAGFSILRAGREIDYGWFFSGRKRKENYDDWWRCEIKFEPDLDEMFGVTHTKQGIHPVDSLISILSPDIERIARTLNGRVRDRFLKAKKEKERSYAERTASAKDFLIEPPSLLSPPKNRSHYSSTSIQERLHEGFSYRLLIKSLDNLHFFVPFQKGEELSVVLNKDHPFYGKLYNALEKGQNLKTFFFKEIYDLLILSAARSEIMFSSEIEKLVVQKFRCNWSNILAAFLT